MGKRALSGRKAKQPAMWSDMQQQQAMPQYNPALQQQYAQQAQAAAYGQQYAQQPADAQQPAYGGVKQQQPSYASDMGGGGGGGGGYADAPAPEEPKYIEVPVGALAPRQVCASSRLSPAPMACVTRHVCQ